MFDNFLIHTFHDGNCLQAYKIFRILLEEKFPRGLQMNLCKELEKETEFLSSGNISAKVSNYKSVAGINNSSNASIKSPLL